MTTTAAYALRAALADVLGDAAVDALVDALDGVPDDRVRPFIDAVEATGRGRRAGRAEAQRRFGDRRVTS